MSLVTVAACAPAATSGGVAATGPATTAAQPTAGSKTTAAATGDADCTKATRVSIGTGGFSPGKVTLQRGAFLFVTNKSSEVHALASTPDAGIVKSVLAGQERQIIQVPKTGTFTITSGSAELRLTVAGESGCDTPEPTLTFVTGYAIKPAKASVVATENFTVVNKSGTAQSVICTPDPGGNGDNTRLEKGETQLLAIDKPGTYVCGSTEHPAAKVTLTVTAK
jgi:hypothetical protein